MIEIIQNSLTFLDPLEIEKNSDACACAESCRSSLSNIFVRVFLS